MVSIALQGLKPGVHTFSFTPSPEDVDLEPTLFSDIQVEATLDYQERRALVMLDASATAHLVCDRTLDAFDEEISGDHQVLYTADQELAGGDGDDEVERLEPGTLELDVTTAVRDTLMLALPLRRVSPAARDLELPTQFGALKDDEGNAIDPRWEALKKLKGE
ncbi:MAG: DUF177 domain-containing protein [Bacteroidota bacterium]